MYHLTIDRGQFRANILSILGALSNIIMFSENKSDSWLNDFSFNNWKLV